MYLSGILIVSLLLLVEELCYIIQILYFFSETGFYARLNKIGLTDSSGLVDREASYMLVNNTRRVKSCGGCIISSFNDIRRGLYEFGHISLAFIYCQFLKANSFIASSNFSYRNKSIVARNITSQGGDDTVIRHEIWNRYSEKYDQRFSIMQNAV